MAKNYPEYQAELDQLMRDLHGAIPETMRGFGQLHNGAINRGELGEKTKELIALGIAIAVRCDGCISYHVKAALKAGATREEIAEAIGVAILMGGGPAVMYGAEALSAVDQFQAVG
jgi:AhpD family alkylhydroperoxidase